jgi:hypothetical protein
VQLKHFIIDPEMRLHYPEKFQLFADKYPNTCTLLENMNQKHGVAAVEAAIITRASAAEDTAPIVAAAPIVSTPNESQVSLSAHTAHKHTHIITHTVST